jgi:hypothetical protein
MADQAAQDRAHYFLSYSRVDERFALKLAADLRDHEVPVWVDQIDIRPSEHWDRAIERAVRACRGLIVVLSPRSVASDNVADEISFAIDSGKSVLPVMIQKCVLPLRITRMHVIDATSNYDRALQQCLAALGPPASGPSDGPGYARAGLTDPEVLSIAKRHLTPFLGPIAGRLVDQAAPRAHSLGELYGSLAEHIDSKDDRARFLEEAPVPQRTLPAEPVASAPGGISNSDVDWMAKTLALYLGPIAAVVAKRESRNCTSLADLRERLAARISAEHDREAFLQHLTSR